MIRAWSRLAARAAPRPVDVHVRHQWPPRFDPPPDGRWVIVQPWEFGSLPRAWIEPINRLVDEVWVPSHYVRSCFIRSGVDPRRVVVIPNGVDPARFHPGAPPLPLPTSKRFRFLFVGGTLARKGADILLDAYLATFRREDDVCLVVKDLGADSFYRGQGLRGRLRDLARDERAPEILYLEDDLPEAALPGLYTACQALVHPFRGEGFGLPDPRGDGVRPRRGRAGMRSRPGDVRSGDRVPRARRRDPPARSRAWGTWRRSTGPPWPRWIGACWDRRCAACSITRTRRAPSVGARARGRTAS